MRACPRDRPPPRPPRPAALSWSAGSSGSTRRSTRWSRPTRASRCWPRATSGPKGRSGRAAALLFSDIPNNVVWRWQRGEGVKRVPAPERLHRQRPARRRAGLERPGRRRDRPALPVPARRPPHRPPRRARRAALRDGRRQVRGQALQQPQRPGRSQPNGDVYFTDPPYGLARHDEGPGARDALQRRLPRHAGRRGRRCSTRS